MTTTLDQVNLATQERFANITLSKRVRTFAIPSVPLSDLYQDANELVLRGFRRYAGTDKYLDITLKSLQQPSEDYLIIVSYFPTKSLDAPIHSGSMF